MVEREFRKCKLCNEDFLVTRNRNVFCSIVCHNTYIARNRKKKEKLKIKCLVCGKEIEYYPSAKRRFCSRSCVGKTRIGEKNSNFNRRWNDEQRERARKRMFDRILKGDFFTYSETKPHKKLQSILEKIGYFVVIEQPVLTYFIDCYDADNHVGYEADGVVWHRLRKSKDAERDEKIFKSSGIPILRITDTDLMSQENEGRIVDEINHFVDVWAPTARERAEGVTLDRFERPNTVQFSPNKKKTAGRKKRGYEKVWFKECKGCGKMFKVTWATRNVFCSRKCYKTFNPSWNTGLTKETHPSLASAAKKISEKSKGRIPALSPDGIEKQKEYVKNARCPSCGTFRLKSSNSFLCANPKCQDFGKGEDDFINLEELEKRVLNEEE